MKKQFKILTLFILCATSLNAQIPSITFTWKVNQAVPDKQLINLQFPIEFVFSNEFNDKSIVFVDNNDITKVIALKDRKFGDSKLKLSGDNFFHFTIDKDGNIVGQDGEVKEDKFKIKIENATPIPVTIVVRNGKGNNQQIDDDYKPGYIYYDAMKLSEDKVDISIKKNILISYGISNFEDTTSNPYLKELAKEVHKMKTDQGSSIGFGSLLTNLGNTDVTNETSAFARVLAEHAKEELNVAFFNKMKERLNAYPELKTVFPKTVSFLDMIETFSYASILNALKEAFEMDMQNLPENLYEIKDLSKER